MYKFYFYFEEKTYNIHCKVYPTTLGCKQGFWFGCVVFMQHSCYTSSRPGLHIIIVSRLIKSFLLIWQLTSPTQDGFHWYPCKLIYSNISQFGQLCLYHLNDIFKELPHNSYYLKQTICLKVAQFYTIFVYLL